MRNFNQNKSSPPELKTDTEKDLRYKLIQKFKKMQERQIAKETDKLKSLVTGKNLSYLNLT